jgi:hypothetical protein
MELAELIDRIERWKQSGEPSSASKPRATGGGRHAFQEKSEDEQNEDSSSEDASLEEAEVGEEDLELDGDDITSEEDETE